MPQPPSGTSRSTIRVRDVSGADELRACQDLQRQAWGITEDGYILPVATMAAAQKVGGLTLGAFAEDGSLVGFSFAFLGRVRQQLILYSQLTGVQPGRQNEGIGRLLKLEQRRRAREMELEAIVWAFDPLQASNAAFNLAVLGATCRTYEIDLYGARSDALNAGVATDRLMAEWPTTGPTQGRSESWPDGVELIHTDAAESGRFRRVRQLLPIPAAANHLHIQAPASIADVKAYGTPAMACDWQLALRDSFRNAFAAGFVAVGFSRTDPDQPRYLLERTA